MYYLIQFIQQFLYISLETAPWLVLGLILAAMLRSTPATRRLAKLPAHRRLFGAAVAAIVGTPLPLCSCSVLPVAMSLKRNGASRGATASFLIATPENGLDSIAVSYALLGPVMMIARPIAAIATAIATGTVIDLLQPAPEHQTPTKQTPQTNREACSQSQDKPADTCCSSPKQQRPVLATLQFAVDELFGDLLGWLALGIALAALFNVLVSPGQLAAWGTGPAAMIVMLIIGLPMYICATASTPIAAALLAAGVSPGAVLVFLLAGPATNLGSLGVVRRELGNTATAVYLTGISLGAIGSGLLLDALNLMPNLLQNATDQEQTLLPAWLSWLCLGLLTLAAIRILWRRYRRNEACRDH